MRGSVASGPEDAAFRQAAREDARGGVSVAQFSQRNAADGDAQAFGEFFLLFRRAVPRHLQPVGVSFSGEGFFQFPECGGGADVSVPEGNSLVEQGVLNVLENIRDGVRQFRFRN